MVFSVASTLLDACVLGVIAQNPTYGYDLTQRLQSTIEISESTLYPVLRRLLKDGLLDTYDEPFDGRNRRYYAITDKGLLMLDRYIAEWKKYKQTVETLLTEGTFGDKK